MHNPLRNLILSIAAIAILPSITVFGEVIYSDDFTLDPAESGAAGRVGFSSGWTEEVGVADKGELSVEGNGSQAVLSRTRSDRRPNATNDFAQITQEFSTVGYTDIAISVEAYQSDGNFEDRVGKSGYMDLFVIQYNIGGDWVDLVSDAGLFNDPIGSDEPRSEGSEGAVSTGQVKLPDSASNNPNLSVRIRAQLNRGDEIYYIDGFELHGTSATAN